MTARTRPSLFYDVAISMCSTYFRRADAKIVFQDDRVSPPRLNHGDSHVD